MRRSDDRIDAGMVHSQQGELRVGRATAVYTRVLSSLLRSLAQGWSLGRWKCLGRGFGLG